jgi:hypothetical protein
MLTARLKKGFHFLGRGLKIALGSVALLALTFWPLSYWSERLFLVREFIPDVGSDRRYFTSEVGCRHGIAWACWTPGEDLSGSELITMRFMRESAQQKGWAHGGGGRVDWHLEGGKGWGNLRWNETYGAVSRMILIRYWSLTCPLWLLAGVAGAWPGVSTILWIRRRGKVAAGYCRRCGYDLRASPERCPECGEVVYQLKPGDRRM